jgi:3-mercaptopyruvate sulfurtransferase SseA
MSDPPKPPRPVLFSPAQLHELLQLDVPGDRVLVLAVGADLRPPPDLKFYIPSSLYLPTAAIEAGPDGDQWTPSMMAPGVGNLLPVDKLCAALADHGINPTVAGATVIVYSAGLRSDPLPAARVVWMLHRLAPTLRLRMLGLLDGGLPGWLAAGFATAIAPQQPRLSAGFDRAAASAVCGGDVAVDACCLATTAEVLSALPGQSSDGKEEPPLIVDVRSLSEYAGVDAGGYGYINVPGRIPGARWGKWGPTTYQGGDWWTTKSIRVEVGHRADPSPGATQMTQLEVQVITLLQAEDMRRMWADCGVRCFSPQADDSTALDSTGQAGRRVIYYCGTGWRSALAWFISISVLQWPMELVANYDGESTVCERQLHVACQQKADVMLRRWMAGVLADASRMPQSSSGSWYIRAVSATQSVTSQQMFDMD